jgi:hypothetical protein
MTYLARMEAILAGSFCFYQGNPWLSPYHGETHVWRTAQACAGRAMATQAEVGCVVNFWGRDPEVLWWFVLASFRAMTAAMPCRVVLV